MLTLLFLSATLFLTIIWYVHCFEKTIKERDALTPNKDDRLYEIRKEIMDNVGFNDHLWRLLTLRRADELYIEASDKIGNKDLFCYW